MKPAPYFRPAFRWRELIIDMFAFAFGMTALVAIIGLLYVALSGMAI